MGRSIRRDQPISDHARFRPVIFPVATAVTERNPVSSSGTVGRKRLTVPRVACGPPTDRPPKTKHSIGRKNQNSTPDCVSGLLRRVFELPMNAEQLAKAKSLGFSDRQIAHLTGR